MLQNSNQVAEVPAGEVDHEEVEGFVDPLLGHHDDGDDVDDDADDGDDEARRTVDPKLQPEVFSHCGVFKIVFGTVWAAFAAQQYSNGHVILKQWVRIAMG